MYKTDSRNGYVFSDEEYARTMTHEMGHVFGIDDGYKDKDDPNFIENIFGITKRPDASDLGLIDEDDVMLYQYNMLNISNADIGMLILAYSNNKFQSYANYTGHQKSKYFEQEGKQ